MAAQGSAKVAVAGLLSLIGSTPWLRVRRFLSIGFPKGSWWKGLMRRMLEILSLCHPSEKCGGHVQLRESAQPSELKSELREKLM